MNYFLHFLKFVSGFALILAASLLIFHITGSAAPL